MIKHIDLFSGIGGFALAADRVFGNVEHIFCDNDLFCQEVLKKHWPNSKIYGDIRALTNADWNGLQEPRAEQQTVRRGQSDENTRPFILTGGFPCQPFSQAGKRKGTEDERHLWPEMLRVIQLTQPEWIIAENVRGLLTQQGGVVFEQVCLDLEASGYEVQPIIIPAVAVNAPHRRDRVWFIAHRNTDGNGCTGGNEEINSTETGKQTLNESTGRHSWSANWLEVATRLCRVDDGLPRRLDRNPRLKALGNAIVPQVAEEIMKAIKSSLV